MSFAAILSLLTSWPAGPPQPNTPIQRTMAPPISPGESSWTKWIPLTVTSVCDGNLRARSRTAPPARIPPGSREGYLLGVRHRSATECEKEPGKRANTCHRSGPQRVLAAVVGQRVLAEGFRAGHTASS